MHVKIPLEFKEKEKWKKKKNPDLLISIIIEESRHLLFPPKFSILLERRGVLESSYDFVPVDTLPTARVDIRFSPLPVRAPRPYDGRHVASKNCPSFPASPGRANPPQIF